MKNYISTIRRSFPIFLSSIGLMSIGITDTIFCSRIDSGALIGQSLASFIYITEFMAFTAFIFPIANIASLAPLDKLKILKSGLLLILLFSFVVVALNFLSAQFISSNYLQQPSRLFFLSYFRIISFALVTGMIFMYSRMTSTLIDTTPPVLRSMLVAFLANLICDYTVLSICTNKIIAMEFISWSTVIIFLFLAVNLNYKLPYELTVQNYFKSGTVSVPIVKKILYTAIPSSLITLCEFSFFCAMGFFIINNVYEYSGIYRVIIQVEEILILPVYAILTIISIDLSKNICNPDKISEVKRTVNLLILTLLIVALFLYFAYPLIIKLYNLDNYLELITTPIIIALFISESLMLMSIMPFRSIAKYNTVLFIILMINWGLTVPFAFIPGLQSLNGYLSLIILNNTLVYITASLIWKLKYQNETATWIS